MGKHARPQVVMTDTSEAAIANGRKIIEKSLSRVARKAFPESESEQRALIDSTFASLSSTTDPAEAVDGTQLVIEAIVENMAVKQQLFKKLDAIASPQTIFATNTSSLSISEIASATSDARQKNFAGLHYFNPVGRLLVSVRQTSEPA
jgi:3-hydroxyacyl-CoA dehydrogenase